ncbi:dihydrofolate reductase [bacterium M00.F.Ca.ET.228.01.1.1]|uniref:dihydrofolate reductase family protein n=1 Tax=Paraburkholderia phenoliruptrix TaxID=252970 RepID=UPI001091E420|nr:dihydrofolate reductase family protein [Paraburkholderia phenoliruptrix]TGP41826.1 dihydrofolate reductase [bacterium M00.F.Ca.ET.228.01.1.1]TGR98617.1 dihydrofolate reductase [bacterium M00.F.Ca.ET.191.01.1.1]TGU02952.1 dihydrofolate reductase [bacterium M00.F.Ca.ET.155.01.1.1]MBW0447694.1 dihydrofolate reductase family protein [Paraburkholderia phenoliruptrix]MBW9098524.1 dihydrofolate reductase family protein [Paraburkholderia phenoliruptrix]
MRKLTVSAFISLDGVIQAPGGPKEDPSGDFRLGGWIVPYADDAISGYLQELFVEPFELLLGRRTYDIFAGYWPHVAADSPSRGIADLLNGVPKHVATHRPDTLEWRESHALAGALADAIRALKQQTGAALLTFGSGNMVAQLLAADLVDELRLVIYPLILGHGKRLFGENAPASAFRLAQSVSTPRGVIITRYVRDGEVRTGSFDADDQGSV